MSGAPFNNAQGDINRYVLNEISDIKTDIGTMKGDLSAIMDYIEGKKTVQKTASDRKFKIGIAGLAAGLSMISSFFMHLLGSN